MERIEWLKANKYQNLDPSIVDAAASADPTTEKKFTDWILRMHSKWGLKASDFQSLTETLSSYNSVRSRMPEEKRDVNAFSSPIELSNAVLCFIRSELAGSSKKNKDDKAVYDVLFESERWLVVRPLTFEAELKYGKSTKWCTAGKDSRGTFYSYMSSGFLYIIIDKSLPDKDPLSKMQFHFRSHGSGMFMNALDERFEILEFFKRHKEIWEVFLNAKEFDGNQNSYFKIIHEPTVGNEDQLSAFKAFGIDVLNMLVRPCDELLDEVVIHISNAQEWDRVELLGESLSRKNIQKLFVNSVLGRNDRGDAVIKKMILSILNSGATIYYEAFVPVLEKYPDTVFMFERERLVADSIPFKLLVEAIYIKPELVKKAAFSRKLIVEIALEVPSVVEHLQEIKFTDDEIRSISKSEGFNARMLVHFKSVPEDVQITFIKKDFDNFKYIKKLTKKAKKTRDDLKREYEKESKRITEEYEKSFKERKKILPYWDLEFEKHKKWAYRDYDYDEYEWNQNNNSPVKILDIDKYDDNVIATCMDCYGNIFKVGKKPSAW